MLRSAVCWGSMLVAVATFSAEVGGQEDVMERFKALAKAEWRTVFEDAGTGDWTKHWFLDGEKATVKNTPDGMAFSAGPTAGDDACHAVLWTRESFKGDVKIEFEFTRTDAAIRFVNIIYIQATGSGDAEHPRDIAAWSVLRKVPAMSLYFNHMDTYHISFAAFGVKNEDPEDDYIRARRYMPAARKGLAGTELKDEYTRTGLFKPNVPYRVTIVKKGQEMFMHIQGDGKEQLCHFRNEALPPITEGRIGLRHMYTRCGRYRDIRISQP